MSGVYDGEDWKRADNAQRQAVAKQQILTRSQQQAWIDEQYACRKMSLKDWRYQFDLLSFANADGNIPEIL